MGGGLADQIAEGITTGNPWLLPLAFVGGLCTSLNPCVYPMLAVVVGYVSAHGDRSAWRSTGLAAAFVLGLALTYAMLGAVGSLLAPVLGLSHRGWLRVVGATCIVAGLFMAGLVPLDLPSFAPGSRLRERLRGAPGALILGALLGLAATPCATSCTITEKTKRRITSTNCTGSMETASRPGLFSFPRSVGNGTGAAPRP